MVLLIYIIPVFNPIHPVCGFLSSDLDLGFAADDQRQLQLNVVSMLSDEVDWLRNFVTSQNEHVHETDNLLLAGHLNLLHTLLTCDGVDKTLSGT